MFYYFNIATFDIAVLMLLYLILHYSIFNQFNKALCDVELFNVSLS